MYVLCVCVCVCVCVRVCVLFVFMDVCHSTKKHTRFSHFPTQTHTHTQTHTYTNTNKHTHITHTHTTRTPRRKPPHRRCQKHTNRTLAPTCIASCGLKERQIGRLGAANGRRRRAEHARCAGHGLGVRVRVRVAIGPKIGTIPKNWRSLGDSARGGGARRPCGRGDWLVLWRHSPVHGTT